MGQFDAGAAPEGAREKSEIRKYVRIIGTRLGKYVEFEFSMNDSDLAVELILPFAAFDDFCALQNVTILPSDPEVAGALEQLAWRERQPGLLRRVKRAQEGEDSQTN